VRLISQSRLHPTVCRIFDDFESKMTGLSPQGKSTLLLEFESAIVPNNLEQALGSTLEICKKFGGKWTDEDLNKNDQKKK